MRFDRWLMSLYLTQIDHVGIPTLRLRHASLHGGDLFQHVVMHLEQRRRTTSLVM